MEMFELNSKPYLRIYILVSNINPIVIYIEVTIAIMEVADAIGS